MTQLASWQRGSGVAAFTSETWKLACGQPAAWRRLLAEIMAGATMAGVSDPNGALAGSISLESWQWKLYKYLETRK